MSMYALKKLFTLALLLFFFIHAGFTQNKVITGKLVDSCSKKALSGITLSINNSNEYSTFSNINGDFTFLKIPNSANTITIKNANTILKEIKLNSSRKNIRLGNIYIDCTNLYSDSNSIISYNNNSLILKAWGFKTYPDAVLKDLVLKLPSITELNNTIYVQGRELDGISVQGKSFFTDNNDIILKKFPANVIDSIRITENISPLSSSISNNIECFPKQENKNSLFGQIYGGIGNYDRYSMGTTINYFQDNRILTLVQEINNINEFSYSTYDANSILGEKKYSLNNKISSNIQTSMLNFINSNNDFAIDQKNGINKTNSFGVSYYDKLGKWNYSGNYFYNQTDNEITINGYRKYFENRNPIYTETGNSASTNINHRFGSSISYSFNDKNKLSFSPKIYIQKTNGSFTAQSKFADTLGLTSSSANNNSIIDATTNETSLGISYYKAFLKENRSLSISATPSYTQTSSSWNLLSNLRYQHLKYVVFDTLTTKVNDKKSNNSVSGEVVYTEPVNKTNNLLFAYIYDHSMSEVNNTTFSKNYYIYSNSSSDSLYINKFNSLYSNNSIKLLLMHKKTNWQFNIGFSYQYYHLNNSLNNITSTNNNFNYFLPVAYFYYSKTNKTNLKINFRTYIEIPSTEQLQNIINIKNPLNLIEGNSNLKPSLNRLFDIRYMRLLNNRISNFYFTSGVLYTEDYIGTQNYTSFFAKPHVIKDSILINISKTINSGQYINPFAYINYNTRFKSISSNFNANINFKYYHIPQMGETNTYSLNQTSSGIGLSLNSDISEFFDFLIASNTNFNTTNTSLSSTLTYFRQNTSIKINYELPFGILISTNILHQYNRGISDGFKDSYFLWNAFIGYKLLKNKNLEFRFSIHDILNQNANIQHNVTNLYIEDVRSNNLQRYFLISFIYNLNITNLKEQPNIYH